MPHRLLAVLATLSLLVGACTSDDSTGPADGVAERVDFDELALGHAPETARFEGVLTVEAAPAAGLGGPVEIFITGTTDPATASSNLTMDLSRVGDAAMSGEQGADLPEQFADLFADPLEIVTIGDTSWMRWPFLNLALGVPTTWLELAPDQAGDVTADFGFGTEVSSPPAFLELLADAEVEARRLGSEPVRGHDTTHYALVVDLDELQQVDPEDEGAELGRELGGLEGPLPFEVWIGGDGRLYRYELAISGSGGQTPDVEAAVVRFEFFDHGAEVAISAPPADQVTPSTGLAASQGAGSGG